MTVNQITCLSVLALVLRDKFETTRTGQASVLATSIRIEASHFAIFNIVGSHSGPLGRALAVVIELA
jgi:hypothetical protein